MFAIFQLKSPRAVVPLDYSNNKKTKKKSQLAGCLASPILSKANNRFLLNLLKKKKVKSLLLKHLNQIIVNMSINVTGKKIRLH